MKAAGHTQGHKVREGVAPSLGSKVFLFFPFFSKIFFYYLMPTHRTGRKAVHDPVKPLLITGWGVGGMGGRKTPLTISHFEDNTLKIIIIITNEACSPAQSHLQFFASHWSSKRETEGRSRGELLNLEHWKPNNYLLKNRIC